MDGFAAIPPAITWFVTTVVTSVKVYLAKFLVIQGWNSVKLWNVETGQELLTFAETRGNYVLFSPDGRSLGVGDTKSAMKLWRAPSLDEIEAVEQARTKAR